MNLWKKLLSMTPAAKKRAREEGLRLARMQWPNAKMRSDGRIWVDMAEHDRLRGYTTSPRRSVPRTTGQTPPSRLSPSPAPAPSPASSSSDMPMAMLFGAAAMHASESHPSAPCSAPSFSSGGGGDYGGGGASGSWDSGSSSSSSDSSSSSSSDSGSSCSSSD